MMVIMMSREKHSSDSTLLEAFDNAPFEKTQKQELSIEEVL